MKRNTPSDEHWRALYNSAVEFAEIKPWEWMNDSKVFGVQNPQTGEIGYCCVLGELGEVMALVVYLGTEGLMNYLDMHSGKIVPGDQETLFIQNCLMASFEDRRDIEKEDVSVIKKLGLKFRGEKAWPLFRRYEPGYVPWYLDRDEALYLTVALQQARDICLRFGDSDSLLDPPKDGCYLVRVLETAGGSVVWEDKWLEPAHLKPNGRTESIVDEIRIQRIKGKALPAPAVWEADMFYLPSPVREGDKPFFPRVLMFADHHSGLLLDLHVTDFANSYSQIVERLLAFIENNAVIPAEIQTQSVELLQLIKSFASRLDIKTTITKKLPQIARAKNELIANMNRF
ncbi:MAG TPA: hypothetical protein DCP92_24035 [Nitrospiraceae bacterium]|jgi:hypothetical protein|nr:hypothetical protein [Nitrospiraceae bacterium]